MTALPWKRARSLGIILILTLIFFNQLAFSGKILARGDTYNYFYPYWDARNLAFREARLPLWTPDLFMGAPLLANPQMGTYYPPNWPTTPFRAPTAIAISILLHTALAAAGTCFLYLEAVSRRWIPALAAGVIFAFGGYLGAHVEQINQLQGLAWMHDTVRALSSDLDARASQARRFAVGDGLGIADLQRSYTNRLHQRRRYGYLRHVVRHHRRDA